MKSCLAIVCVRVFEAILLMYYTVRANHRFAVRPNNFSRTNVSARLFASHADAALKSTFHVF